ncbi:MAG: hypothetical protein Ta2G_01580 [Termitinemataceae bacterium]|nr:MAG: hypothetical protein Ta2G_01580 [Termitinemataceae bacterium]
MLIGSGPIESANKVVVQRRCKQSGMHCATTGSCLIYSLIFDTPGWGRLGALLFYLF